MATIIAPIAHPQIRRFEIRAMGATLVYPAGGG
jgi:hypothetical protein